MVLKGASRLDVCEVARLVVARLVVARLVVGRASVVVGLACNFVEWLCGFL